MHSPVKVSVLLFGPHPHHLPWILFGIAIAPTELSCYISIAQIQVLVEEIVNNLGSYTCLYP